jgi:DNA-binding NtrC family response regulator
MGSNTENEDKIKDRFIHVLLVDDEYNIVLVNQMVLEQMGYIVKPAYGSREALSLIEESPEEIDVVITDYLMQEMNGIELAIEAKKYMPDTPFILYSGKAEFIDEKQIAEAGIVRVIIKPFKMKDLDIIIKDLLNKETSS